ncbi:MAG: hypothetical protein JWP11_3806 [Frankiales bacterium]|nr:hypothetical protein [Frankiales bacterium]
MQWLPLLLAVVVYLVTARYMARWAARVPQGVSLRDWLSRPEPRDSSDA